MKSILAIILLPFAALALNPSAPVVRLDGGEVVERRNEIPVRYGSTVNYNAAGEWRWYQDGWRQAAITTLTNTETISIPAPIQAVAAAYQAAFDGIYGQGGHTNRALTHEAVAIDMSLRHDVSADTGIRLQTWFEILNGYWGRGEIWTFPWGAAEYTTTNTTEEWSPVP